MPVEVPGSSEGLGVDARLQLAVHLAVERSPVPGSTADSKALFEATDYARLVYLVMRADYEEQLLILLADFFLAT
jgi:hypothetical protein